MHDLINSDLFFSLSFSFLYGNNYTREKHFLRIQGNLRYLFVSLIGCGHHLCLPFYFFCIFSQKKVLYSKIHSSIGISKAIGFKVQNGYGLTETSLVVAARRPDCNVLGTVG